MFLYHERTIVCIWSIVMGIMFTCYGLFFKKHYLLQRNPGRPYAMPRWIGLIFYVGLGLLFLTSGILRLVQH